MLDSDADAEDRPETQLETDGDGASKPPRKTAVEASDSGPKPWAAASDAQKFYLVPYASIDEALQVEETANFKIMSRAHKYLMHCLDTSLFYAQSAQAEPARASQQAMDRLAPVSGKRARENFRKSFCQSLFRRPGPLSGFSAIAHNANQHFECVYHPDNPATFDEGKYKIAQEAWNVLSDRDLRGGYDEGMVMGNDKT